MKIGIYEFDKSLANEKFSKIYTDTLLKSKPIYYKVLSHNRKLKITDPSEKNAKKNKIGTIELINTSSENTQINPQRGRKKYLKFCRRTIRYYWLNK